MEEKPVFIIVGTLTVLIGLVPLLNVMNTMSESTSKSHDTREMERIMEGIDDECNDMSGFVPVELQAGTIKDEGGGEIQLHMGDETSDPIESEECAIEFVGDISDGIPPGSWSINFSNTANTVQVGTHQ